MGKEKTSAEQTINTIRRKTQRKHSAEEKIRIVLLRPLGILLVLPHDRHE